MNDQYPEDIDLIYQDIKDRVTKRYEFRTQFFGHLVAFFVAGLFSIALVASQTVSGFFMDLLILAMIGWFLGISVHAVNWAMSELRERALRREMESAGLSSYIAWEAQKRKRSRAAPPQRLVRLSDDGELVQLYVDDDHDARIS